MALIRKEYDVVVIGAGPAGSMAAKFAAEKGISVLMLEKDRDVGYPVRCGEAVSKAGIEEFVTSDEKWISAKLDKFSVNSPDGSEVIVESPHLGYVLERRVFDYELAKAAAAEGAEILTKAYVNGLLFDGDKVSGVKFEHLGEQQEIKAKVVIAADGIESRAGRWAGLKTHTDFREMESCVQVTASNIINIKKDTLYFYFGKDIAPGGYFWVFPKQNNSANIGLGINGAENKKKSALSYLNDFMSSRYPGAPVTSFVAGGVPSCVSLEKIAAPGILLTGDAARQINPLSGGGIASGMIGGSIAGRVAAEAVKSGRLDDILVYEKEWHDRLGKRHEIFNRLKLGIYDFSDETFNKIAHTFLKIPENKRSLGKLFRTALVNHPSLLLDIAKVFVI